jgi:hypothetical protein
MRFRLKELFIQIVPEGEAIGGRWGFPGGDCEDISCSPSCVFCTNAPSDCTVHGSVPVYCFDSAALDPNPLKRLESLRTLKAHLSSHLAAAEAAERAAKRSLDPDTRAEIEMLESHLERALDEVRARKAALPPKRAPARKPRTTSRR